MPARLGKQQGNGIKKGRGLTYPNKVVKLSDKSLTFFKFNIYIT